MLDKKFLQKMKDSLLLEKASILVKSSIREDIDTDGDEADEVQGNMLIELNNQLHSRNNIKLSQIDDSLKRIADLTYGICEECDEPIPEKRLLVNPYFLNCVVCAEQKEIQEKQRRRS